MTDHGRRGPGGRPASIRCDGAGPGVGSARHGAARPAAPRGSGGGFDGAGAARGRRSAWLGLTGVRTPGDPVPPVQYGHMACTGSTSCAGPGARRSRRPRDIDPAARPGARMFTLPGRPSPPGSGACPSAAREENGPAHPGERAAGVRGSTRNGGRQHPRQAGAGCSATVGRGAPAADPRGTATARCSRTGQLRLSCAGHGPVLPRPQMSRSPPRNHQWRASRRSGPTGEPGGT